MFKKFDFVQTSKIFFPKPLLMAASDLIHKKEFLSKWKLKDTHREKAP